MILPNIWKIIKFMFQTTNQPLCTHCITIYLDESPFLMDESPNSTQFWRPGVPTFGRALPFIVYLAASLFVRWRELDLVCFSQHDRCVLHIWPTNIRVFPFLFSTGTWFVYLIHTYWRCFFGLMFVWYVSIRGSPVLRSSSMFSRSKAETIPNKRSVSEQYTVDGP